MAKPQVQGRAKALGLANRPFVFAHGVAAAGQAWASGARHSVRNDTFRLPRVDSERPMRRARRADSEGNCLSPCVRVQTNSPECATLGNGQRREVTLRYDMSSVAPGGGRGYANKYGWFDSSGRS